MEGAVRLSGLWKNEGKHGSYLAGSLGTGRLFVMKNERKGDTKDPDFIVYLKPQAKKEDDGARDGKAAAAGDFLD